MTNSLSNLVDNLVERMIQINVNIDVMIKNVKRVELNIRSVSIVLKTYNLKMI